MCATGSKAYEAPPPLRLCYVVSSGRQDLNLQGILLHPHPKRDRYLITGLLPVTKQIGLDERDRTADPLLPKQVPYLSATSRKKKASNFFEALLEACVLLGRGPILQQHLQRHAPSQPE